MIDITITMFNAPPYSGKDAGRPSYMHKVDIAGEIKKRIACLYNIPGIDFYEKCKDTPLSEFRGQSFREAIISLSEDYMKPKFGNDIWAVMAAGSIREIIRKALFSRDSDASIAITDIGFDYEVTTIKKILDEYFESYADVKITYLLVHVVREGCNYDNDSREHVHGPDVGVTEITVNNALALGEEPNGVDSILDFKQEVHDRIEEAYKKINEKEK